MATSKPFAKTPANSKQYSLTLKIATGGMKFPTSFVQANTVISSPFHRSFGVYGFTSLPGACFVVSLL
jgi:hypothetical protein